MITISQCENKKFRAHCGTCQTFVVGTYSLDDVLRRVKKHSEFHAIQPVLCRMEVFAL